MILPNDSVNEVVICNLTEKRKTRVPKMTDSNFDTVIERLKEHKTTEELLVALTLLPRILNQNDEFQVEQAFESIPWKSIHQMMLTDGMEHVGIYIWQAFCIPKYMKHRNLTRRIEPATTLLKMETIDVQLKEVIMRTLVSIALQDIGLITLESLTNILNGVGVAGEIVQFIDLILSSDANDLCLDAVFEACMVMLEENSVHAIRLTSLVVFSLELEAKHVKKLKIMLKKLLKCKWDSENLDRILCICGKLSANPVLYENDQSQDPKSLSEGQFWVILTHLSGAEIRLALDNTTSQVDNFKISVTMYYMILENLISAMVEEKISVSFEQLESIRKSMCETFFTIASFLSERWVLKFNQDQYQDSNNIRFLDNELVVYSFQAYCHWIAEESAVSLEELLNLAPLVVAMLQVNYKIVEFNVWNYCIELLTALTSEPEVLDIFIEHSGDIVVMNRFKSDETRRSELLDSVVVNIIASKGVTSQKFLEKRFQYYFDLIPVFLDILVSGTVEDQFHALICYLLLYRASPKYRTTALPLEKIGEILLFRYISGFPEYLIDYFDLILLSIFI